MTRLRIELSSNNEIVTSSIITKLYELAYAGLDASSNLKGYITATHAKRTLVEYLLNLYPELTINVTGEYYVEFADPNTEKLLMSTYNISGEGICPGDITEHNIHNMDGFNGHPSITSFNELPLFTSITKIAGQGLLGQDQLTSIDLQNITGIDNYGFLGCTRLASLGDTSNITYIYQQAFSGCVALTNLSFPSLTSTYRNAFEGCTGLLTVNIPWGQLTNTSRYTIMGLFAGCSSLVSVPNFTLATVLGSMFLNCGELLNIDLSNVTTIEEAAFMNCNKLNLLQCGLNWRTLLKLNAGGICGCKGVGEVELPSYTHTELSYGAFCNNSDFTKISNVSSITQCYAGGSGNLATFESCPALRVIDLSKSTLLTKIYKWLYKNEHNSTSAIEKIVLPSSILNISSDAFWITRKNSAPNFKGLICYATTPPTINNANLTQTATHLLFNYYPTTAGIYVPASAVTDYQTAWADCASLIHEIKEFPGEMEFVDKTFSASEFGGASFSSVIIKGNTTIIPVSCFMGAASLEHVQINAPVTQIGGSAFRNTALTSFEIPNTVTRIDNNAFTNSKLTQIIFPQRQISVEGSAFHDISTLEYVYIPSTMTTIPSMLFAGCNALCKYYISEGVTTFAGPAFSTAKRLILPSTVTTLNNAFLYTQRDFMVIKATTVPQYNSDCFKGNWTYNIYVPDESVTAYKALPGGTGGYTAWEDRVKPISQFSTDWPGIDLDGTGWPES